MVVYSLAKRTFAAMTPDKKHLILIVLSFFAIYFIWGSTYLFVAIAVEEIPPWKMAGVRFLIAALVISAIVALTKQWKGITKTQVINATIAGFMFLTLGNGAMTYGLQYVDSGFAALIIAASPLVMLIMLYFFEKTPISPKSWIGIALGIFGMYLLVSQDQIIQKPGQWKGLLAVVSCLFTWGYASIFVKNADVPKSYVANTGIQMITAGTTMMLISLLIGEPSVDWLAVSQVSWGSILYLAVFGSVFAFTAFNFLLKHISPEKVSTSTYINPIVALFLGWYFRDELVTNQSMTAAGILLLGVYFINSRNYKKKQVVTGKSE